ncbi:MAG: SAM-dependent methyltransferase [Candidatus Dormibacteraceae bacterium]
MEVVVGGGDKNKGLVIDESIPSIARIYDYFLGGKDNYACDRKFAAELVEVAPEVGPMANDNRAFLGRVVRFLAQQGINQFIDIGTGLPTQNNVHEVAQGIIPNARVVYVDNDPVVLVHARALLMDNPYVVVVDADLRKPENLINDPAVRDLIDFSQPLAILLVGILYFLANEEEPDKIVSTLRKAMPSNSYLALSHIISDDRPDTISQVQELYRGFMKGQGNCLRTRKQVQAFFGDLEMVDPGLVYAYQWHAGAQQQRDKNLPRWMLGGVARKR